MSLPTAPDSRNRVSVIGVIADTHVDGGPADLPQTLSDALAGTDLILHAGDIGSHAALAALGEIAPVVAVKGNSLGDLAPPLRGLPRHRKLEIDGHTLVLTHGNTSRIREHRTARWGSAVRQKILRSLDRPFVRKILNLLVLARLVARFQGKADCVVYGHTHIPTAFRFGSTLYVNPGDAQYRSQPQAHLAILEIRAERPVRAQLLKLSLSR